ncbi:MarR family transcriptional regulator [Cronobacter malonaticus]|nr:MarR family transcriptional regulator [Cronobacter malonaticus]
MKTIQQKSEALSLDLDNQLCFALYSTNLALHKIYRQLLTPLLKRMETAGLLMRQRSRQDERQVIVTLTDAGRKLKAEAHNIPGSVLCATACDKETLLDLKDQLDALRHNLNQQ